MRTIDRGVPNTVDEASVRAFSNVRDRLGMTIITVRLNMPNEFKANPPASPAAMGMTWRRTRKTRTATNIMSNVSMVMRPVPRAAVCVAYDCTMRNSNEAIMTVKIVMRP